MYSARCEGKLLAEMPRVQGRARCGRAGRGRVVVTNLGEGLRGMSEVVQRLDNLAGARARSHTRLSLSPPLPPLSLLHSLSHSFSFNTFSKHMSYTALCLFSCSNTTLVGVPMLEVTKKSTFKPRFISFRPARCQTRTSKSCECCLSWFQLEMN